MESIYVPPEKCRTSGDGMEEEIATSKVEPNTEIIASNDVKTPPQTKIVDLSANALSPRRRSSLPSSSARVDLLNSSVFPGLHRKSCQSSLNSITYRPRPGNLVLLTPRLVKSNLPPIPDHKNVKSPRFVPCEPYVGAVTHLTADTRTVYRRKSKTIRNMTTKKSDNESKERVPTTDENPPKSLQQERTIAGKHETRKNNLDINFLVQQMSNLRAQELLQISGPEESSKPANNDIKQLPTNADKQENADQLNESNSPNDKDTQEAENSEYVKKLQEQVESLTEERNYFQNQLKFQAQVNGELKNLLVASVGEDLQTRVNVLTEDKLQLAKALLDTAKHLSTHTEQIEFLAGQCEVWRSKFLATSVMVEELARWKADLTEKNELLTTSTKKLLAVVQQVRDMQVELIKNLKFIAKVRELNLPATDVVTVSAENLNISQLLVLHSGVGMPQDTINTISNQSIQSPTQLQGSLRFCEAERYALQALDFISQPLMATDEAIKALFGQTQQSYVSGMALPPQLLHSDSAET